MQAAANIAWALKAKTADTGLVLTLPEANSFGLAMLDPQPLSAALAALESGDADTLVVLENDLERRAPKAALEAALKTVKNLIVIDHSASAKTARAQVFMQAETEYGGHGTLINYRGSSKPNIPVFKP